MHRRSMLRLGQVERMTIRTTTVELTRLRWGPVTLVVHWVSKRWATTCQQLPGGVGFRKKRPDRVVLFLGGTTHTQTHLPPPPSTLRTRPTPPPASVGTKLSTIGLANNFNHLPLPLDSSIRPCFGRHKAYPLEYREL